MAEEIDDQPQFDRAFAVGAGRVQALTPLVRRLVAPNPGPFTFTGTCTYVVGQGNVAVIDPGRDDPAHLEALAAALEGETVTHILVTHTHRDHSPAARALKARTGALIVGCGPHRAARPLGTGEHNAMDAAADAEHVPEGGEMGEGDAVTGPGWTLTAVATPGHTANHLAFALLEESSLFSGDHVMAWTTSIVAPPDGSMAAYKASLDHLRRRAEADRLYWPGHGGPVQEPARFVRALAHHRRQREHSILARLSAGDRTVGAIVPRIYEGLAPALHGAAGLSVLAHLEDLVARGQVRVEGPFGPAARFQPAG